MRSSALLLDPSREDPTELIRYEPAPQDGNLRAPRRLRNPLPPEMPRFVPVAFTGDRRAVETLSVLGLASGALDANWEKHLSPI